MKRRTLLKSAAAVTTLSMTSASAFGHSFLPFSQPRTLEKLRVAAIGFGGRGKDDLNGMKGHPAFQLTAACDVDASFFPLADTFGDNVIKLQDYRRLFAEHEGDFDAVVIATPDHMHAPIALLAMEHDKHVFLQKPLAQDIKECRTLAEASARKPELATQMGIQIHGDKTYRTAVSWLQQGVIGTVKEIHSWSGKGWGGEFKTKASTPAPSHLDWNLYCGVSPLTDYVEGWYHRGNWRKWLDFGTGTQGDMGCHIVDPVFTAMELKEPTRITSFGPPPFEKNYALISHVEYEFKGTKYTTDKIKMSWYNGSLRPKKLNGLPADYKLPHQGSVLIGEKGSFVIPHVAMPLAFNLDGTKMDKLPPVVPSVNHFQEWIDVAIGKQETTGAPFSYSGPLTEAVLLGTIINRWPKEEFIWDAKSCRFEGDSEMTKEANRLLAPLYRKF